MKCQKCGQREATVRLTKVSPGKKEETFLCEQCLGIQKDVTVFDFDLNVDQFIGGLLSGLTALGGGGIPDFNKPLAPDIKCPVCGEAFSEFSKTGKLGCSSCYSAFRSRLEGPLKKIHGNVRHSGKVPDKFGGEIKIKRRIGVLELELKEAISKENFERAAVLRDRIKEIKDAEASEKKAEE